MVAAEVLSSNPTPSEISKVSRGKGTIKKQGGPSLGRFLPVFSSLRPNDSPIPEHPISNLYQICNICHEQFQDTHSPFSASLAANTSARFPFGLRLPCPEEHTYCISCLTEYIKGKLDPSGSEGANTYTTVFPIPCPDCPIIDWGSGIQDDVVERIFDTESMSVWVYLISKQLHVLAY